MDIQKEVQAFLAQIQRSTPRVLILQVLSIFMMGVTAWMTWTTLKVVTDTESPIVVVLSGSMEPGFQRGDLLFLYEDSSSIEIGDIVVYKVRGQAIPIVHRVLKIHETDDGPLYLTKGDANYDFDTGIYEGNSVYLPREEIIGRVRGYLPWIGYATIAMKENQYVQYVVVGLLIGSAILGS